MIPRYVLCWACNQWYEVGPVLVTAQGESGFVAVYVWPQVTSCPRCLSQNPKRTRAYVPNYD